MSGVPGVRRVPAAPRAPRALFAPAAAFLALAVAWAWPLPLHLANRFAHDPGDPLLVTYLLWWNAHVVPLSDAMWSAPFYWPLRDALALTEHGAGMGIVTSPLQWLGGSPLFAYNVLLIVSTWLSALAAYALVRRLTGNVGAAFCAGLAYGFAPYRASQLAHLHLLVAWWMPLALLALHAYYDDGRRRWLGLFGVSWLLQALTNGYYLFFFPVLLLVWTAVFTTWRSSWRRAVAVALTWLVFSLPLLPVLWKYYAVQQALGVGRTRGEMQMFSATLASFWNSSALLRFWPGGGGQTQEDFLFPGATALLAIAAAISFHRWRGAAARSFFFYVSAAVLMAWLAFGPAAERQSIAALWRPYEWIAWMPGFNGLRVPARFFMLATLCLAVAAGLAVAGLSASHPRHARFISAIAALGLLADGWISAMPLGVAPRGFATPLAKGAVVLELPMTDDNVNVGALYRGTMHGLPVVNGYAGYVPPHASIIDWALVRRDPSILTELRRGRPLYVAVGNHAEAPSWTAFIEAQNGAELLEVGGAGRLYRLPPAPFARLITAGAPLHAAGVTGDTEWLTLDLGSVQTVRVLELRTRGHVVRLRATVRVETSVDGVTWTLAADEPSAGLAFAGVLVEPRAVPVRLIIPDAQARYVRVDTPAFAAAAVTIYGPG